MDASVDDFYIVSNDKNELVKPPGQWERYAQKIS